MKARPVIGTVMCSLLGLLYASFPLWAEDSSSSDNVRAGHRLAILVCGNCHVAAADQPNEPILRAPAPALKMIAQRKDISAAWIKSYLQTTHKGLDNPRGMPNPDLIDSQLEQITAYILSLRQAAK